MNNPPLDSSYRFVSEPLKPVMDSADTAAMVAGAPGLPGEFIWRGEPLEVARVIQAWNEAGPSREGPEELYLRKHWYEIETGDGRKARIYFERQARGRNFKKRWWLFAITTEESACGKNTD